MSSSPAGYRRLVVASGASNLADGVFLVALPLLALGITRDPGAFASVTLVGRLPWLIFSLPAGALADRLDRKRTMVLVQVLRAALLGGLALVVAAGREELWVLYVVAFGLGVGETLFDTAAQSILPNIVKDPGGLARANGRLYAVELAANQFVGPPLGGLVAGLTLAGALTGSAVAYGLAALALLGLVGSFRPVRHGAPTRMHSDIREGLGYLLRHRVLRTLALCVGLSNLAYTAQMAVFALYVVAPGPMGLSEVGFGLLLTAGAVGSLAASPVVGRVESTLGRRRALLVCSALFPVAAVVPAVTAQPAPVFAGFALAGAAIVVWNVITVSLRQRVVPDHLLGRINSGYRLLAWGTMPLGAALGGVLGELIGLRGTFLVCGVIGLGCIPLLLAHTTDATLGDGPPATELMVRAEEVGAGTEA